MLGLQTRRELKSCEILIIALWQQTPTTRCRSYIIFIFSCGSNWHHRHPQVDKLIQSIVQITGGCTIKMYITSRNEVYRLTRRSVYFLWHLCLLLCSFHPSFWQAASQKYAVPPQDPDEAISAAVLFKMRDLPYLHIFSTGQYHRM